MQRRLEMCFTKAGKSRVEESERWMNVGVKRWERSDSVDSGEPVKRLLSACA